MKILIKVTKEILERSKMCGHKQGDHEWIGSKCAIALAVRDMFPRAYVFTTAVAFNGYGTSPEVSLPSEAVEFIINFDCAVPADRPNLPEFSFEIDVPSEVIEKIGLQEVYKILSESRTLELVMPV